MDNYRQFPGGIFSFLYPGQQQPSGPPPGFGPGQGPGGGFGPGQGPGQGPPAGPPPGPPPSTLPQQQADVGVFAVDPGSLYGCLYRYTFIRLENGRRFWFYPVFIGRTSVAGWRWRPRQFRWVYTGFDTRQIASFQCH
ncbi:hypothetical protein [Alteribacter populi]|uniref:hypothetical protein n=1 Tax=Alteribacter populi TaxID=2011011 RepID=UPI000BBAB139|nr:hypothetical protein [Alteribacter populi]